jgi:hypothetical protein
MRKVIIAMLLLFAGFGFAQESSSQPQPQPSQPVEQQSPPPDCKAKVAPFVAASGYKAIPTRECGVYVIVDALPDLPHNGLQGMLLVAQDEASDMLLIGAVVQPKADVDLSQASLLKLLQLSNELDYAKLGIDHNGDLFVRTENSLRSTDEASFKQALEQVVKASNQVYAAVKK